MRKVFVALDNMTDIEILSFLEENKDHLSLIKIGLEVYLKYGNEFIQKINKLFHFEIFLDLKLHDIPNTVASSIKSLKGLKIDFLTLHLSGGASMLAMAKEARDKYLPGTKLIGVSILTSLDESDCLEIFNQKTNEAFTHLIAIAQRTKLDGIVCSGFELGLMAKDSPLITICPGIRVAEDNCSDDQKRVMTPAQAFQSGANYLVMGRAIRNNPSLMRNKSFWSAF